MTTTQSKDATTETSHKVRYAVIGLGWFAQSAALPAFAHAENSELVALVSNDAEKRTELSQKYRVQHTCSYEEYDELLSSGLIDAVYIALPNHLHCEYAIRAAIAGIHVLCEKPMAVTVEECETMIKAAKDNHIKLMIAYRLHLEETNLEAVDIVSSGQIGEPRIFNSLFTQQTEDGNIRVKKQVGGGTLEDIGIYCINAARYLFQSEPIAAFATSANNGEERFSEVAEMTTAILRFPSDRLATFTTSFGAAKVSSYQVVGTKGDLRVESAYSIQGDMKHTLTIEDKIQERTFPSHDQLASMFVYFSDCILQNREPEPSGEEGLIDIKIIRALHDSIETGTFVQLDHIQRNQHPTKAQMIERPPAEEQPAIIHAASPSGS